MFPRISDLFNSIFGSQLELPVQTYGFFLAVAFLVAGCMLWLELKRKEREGTLEARIKVIQLNKKESWFEILIGTSLSALIGYKFFGVLLNYQLFAQAPQDYLLSGGGSLSAAIIILILSIGHAAYRNYKKGLKETEWVEQIIHPSQNTWSILIIAIISALAGSKLFDILDNFQSFLQDPVHSILSFSGLTFYGGLIVTVITLIFYMRTIHLDWKQVIDAAAPAIMIGYAIGRLGCHLSGDGCWGIVNELDKPGWLSMLPDWAWSSQYPHNVIRQGIHIPGCIGTNCTILEKPVWPTSLYESFLSVLSFGVLWICRRKMKAAVTLFGLFLILNGVERFFIEKIRVNHRYSFLGLYPTQAEIISFILVISGCCIIWYFTRIYLKKCQQE
jgi:phosphatidylglycerol---prolipoprotein diacylglyceryl transferase